MKSFVRVTDLTGLIVDFSMVPKATLDLAILRGNTVHAACSAIAKGEFPVYSDEYEGYIQSFERWLSLVEDFIAVEPELRDPRIGLIGHPDFIVKLKDHRLASIVDLKTPITRSKAWRIQVCGGYTHLARVNGYNIGSSGALQPDPKGGPPRMTWYKDNPHDLQALMSLLNIFRYMKGGD